MHAPPVANTTPLDGFQHFGEVEATRHELTVWLRDATGASLWSKTLGAV
ncbi:alkaline phosphatase D [Lentzea fradiae]|uniref:Alkaline phosphatase D n=1 Tax=Lentzea fradiae TaxID=200378 RepID=A0A1G7S4Z3_9PSEU|nr:alkaline phosphatase D [Lentzea fradiae]